MRLTPDALHAFGGSLEHSAVVRQSKSVLRIVYASANALLGEGGPPTLPLPSSALSATQRCRSPTSNTLSSRLAQLGPGAPIRASDPAVAACCICDAEHTVLTALILQHVDQRSCLCHRLSGRNSSQVQDKFHGFRTNHYSKRILIQTSHSQGPEHRRRDGSVLNSQEAS